MAAARMVLLAMSVLLFAAAWSGDRPHDRRDTTALRRGVRPARTANSTRQVSLGSRTTTKLAASSASAGLPEFWHSGLPMGVAAGEYQLVESTGRTQRVVLSAEVLQTLGQDPDVGAEPLYTLTLPGRTAYLIRMTPMLAVDRIAARK